MMVASVVHRTHDVEILLSPEEELLVARLTRAAYDVALRHAPDQPFTELELSLWREIRAVIQTGESVDLEG
jgi:hypothetical protein